jgi:hypothetical protein
MVFALLLVSQLAWAGTSLWNFENAAQADEWEVANGQWSVKSGVYQETSGAEAAMHSIVGDVNWDNYVIEAKVRLDQGNWAGIVFRAQNEFEYYIYYVNVQENVIELWRHTKGAFDARANIRKVPTFEGVVIKNNEWYDIKVVAEGDTFELWINGKFQGEDKDAVYKTGKIGVWAWQTKASFDDVKVTGAKIPNNAAFAVDPKDKLTTTWANIKHTR